MKSSLKRVIALTGCAVITAGSIAGCGVKKSESNGAAGMFDVLKNATELESYTSVTTFSGEVEGTSFEAVLTTKTDGEATSASIELSAAGMSFEFEDFMIYTDDIVYINLGGAADELSAYLAAADLSLSELGIESDWVYIEADGVFAKDTTLTNMFYDDFEKAYADLIEEDDDVYTLEIEDDDALEDFIKATNKMVEDNSKDWSKALAKYYDNNKIEVVITAVIKDFCTSVAELAKVDADELYDSVMEEADFSEIENLTEDDFQEMFDALASGMEDTDDVTLEDATMVITAEEDKDEYSFTIVVTDSTSEITISTVITEDKDVEVDVPSKNNAQPFGEVAGYIYIIYTMSTLEY